MVTTGAPNDGLISASVKNSPRRVRQANRKVSGPWFWCDGHIAPKAADRDNPGGLNPPTAWLGASCSDGVRIIISKTETHKFNCGYLSLDLETLQFIPSMRQTQQAASMWPWRRPPDDPTTTSSLERI